MAALLLAPLGPTTAHADPGAIAGSAPVGQVVTWGGSSLGSWTITPPPGLTATAVVASDICCSVYALAVRPDGTVVGWGDGAGYGETRVPDGLRDVTAVDTGSGFSVAVRADGSVVAWGSNWTHQTEVPTDLGRVVAVSAGGFRGVHNSACGFAVALRANGTVRAWGQSPTENGCSAFTAQAAPPAGLRQVTAVATGSRHALALRSDGTVVGWGADGSGQATPPADLDHVVQVVASGATSAALRENGTVVQWGATTDLPPDLGRVVSLSGGYGGFTALRADGTTRTWGSRVPSATPPDGPGLTAVSLGEEYGVGLVTPTAVGTPRVTTRTDSNPAGTAEAFRYVAGAAADASSLGVYLDRRSTAKQVVLGLYSDVGGRPGRLLAQGSVTAPVAGGWNSAPLATTPVTAGKAYWLAVLAPARSGTVRFRDLPDGTGGAAQTSAQSTLTSLPTTWSPGRAFGNAPASLYAG